MDHAITVVNLHVLKMEQTLDLHQMEQSWIAAVMMGKQMLVGVMDMAIQVPVMDSSLIIAAIMAEKMSVLKMVTGKVRREMALSLQRAVIQEVVLQFVVGMVLVSKDQALDSLEK